MTTWLCGCGRAPVTRMRVWETARRVDLLCEHCDQEAGRSLDASRSFPVSMNRPYRVPLARSLVTQAVHAGVLYGTLGMPATRQAIARLVRVENA